jgi:tRNA-binding protein
MLTWEEFEKVDIRVGTVISVDEFPKANKPAYKLKVDFGTLGMKQTSAQITKLYSKTELEGKQVIAVVNFKPKKIADFISECLILGIVGQDNEVILLTPDKKAKNGDKIS